MTKRTAIAETHIRVSFGDCDPAGIVFYPNFYRWVDGLFHLFLDGAAGGHAALCERIGSVGIGLKAAEMSFRSPVMPGQELKLEINRLDWKERSFEVTYLGMVGDRTAIAGKETRTVFVKKDARIRAGNTAELRSIFDKSA